MIFDFKKLSGVVWVDSSSLLKKLNILHQKMSSFGQSIYSGITSSFMFLITCECTSRLVKNMSRLVMEISIQGG